jgi:Skp family chaperone for outer membrane proteins
MQQTLQQRATEFQNQVQQREAELIGPIEKRIRSIVDGYRAEKNIGLVFDIGPASGGLIAVDPALDITSAVIARLKAGQ